MTAKSIRQPPALSLLLDGARLLHPLHRPRFLVDTTEQLMQQQFLDEHTVRQTVRECLYRIDLWGRQHG